MRTKINSNIVFKRKTNLDKPQICTTYIRCFLDGELHAEEAFAGDMHPVRLSKLIFGGSMEGRLFNCSLN